jgi:DNA-directed RNA polymerase subunit K/omega/pimeloyl-ACP methyl ester carboxylesterase
LQSWVGSSFSGNRFLFATLASQRAHQLARGALPRVEQGHGSRSIPRLAMREVTEGLVPYWEPAGTEPTAQSPFVARREGELLVPASLVARGGLSVVIEDPASIMDLQAACLSNTVESLYQALSSGDSSSLWRTWQPPQLSIAREETGSDSDLLRAALGALRTVWEADGNRRNLVMTVTLARPGAETIEIEGSEPVLLAYPGSVALTIAGRLLKPVAWVVTLGTRGGFSADRKGDLIRADLRQRALAKANVLPLSRIEDLQPAAVRKATRLVVFIHGLFSTDVGTFDALIGRVQLLRPDAIVAGFSHNTLTAIENNALMLSRWLAKLVPLDANDDFKIALVGHSRGGLVARATAVKLFEADERWKDVIRGGVSFGTPHEGARLAEAPNEMAAAIAVLAVLDGAKSAASLVDILTYCASEKSLEGVEDLRPLAGTGSSRERFLKILGNNELKFGALKVMAFGGAVDADTVTARIISRSLGSVENDHVVERSSSTPALFSPDIVPTHCNHFGYFEQTDDNKRHLDQAARHVAQLLA